MALVSAFVAFGWAFITGLVLLGGGPWGSAGDRNVPTLIEELTLTKAALQKGLRVAAMQGGVRDDNGITWRKARIGVIRARNGDEHQTQVA